MGVGGRLGSVNDPGEAEAGEQAAARERRHPGRVGVVEGVLHAGLEREPASAGDLRVVCSLWPEVFEDVLMETDVKAAQMKITYATMSAEQMDDLHKALDQAIAQVKGTFGRTYPMYIDGQPVEAGKTFVDESPIDDRPATATDTTRVDFFESIAVVLRVSPID